ncbi:UNVERIFIED_CONTAM: Granule-bound starch synthase 1, chloroplastic/amyloplastic [Sesamum calycinum]|uniref:Granule-bound starch synthase 1, chloroplastic/amyloplastic n=1 Tax=Sesamum calycinum TaxID=2727403 RepID=A0AAW2M2A6_9LAMI
MIAEMHVVGRMNQYYLPYEFGDSVALTYRPANGLRAGPAKNWELLLLSLGVAGSEPGIEGEEIAPLAKENVATP